MKQTQPFKLLCYLAIDFICKVCKCTLLENYALQQSLVDVTFIVDMRHSILSVLDTSKVQSCPQERGTSAKNISTKSYGKGGEGDLLQRICSVYLFLDSLCKFVLHSIQLLQSFFLQIISIKFLPNCQS